MKTLKNFLTEKGIEMSAFEGMTADKQAELYNELNGINATAYKELNDKVEAGASKEDLEKLAKDINEARDEQMKHLNETIKLMGLAIKNKENVGKDDISLTAQESLDKGLKDNADALKVTIKAVGDMTIVGNISGGNVPVEQREAGVNRIARRNVFIRELINNGTATSNLISWVEQTGVEGAPGGTVEGTLKNQIDFDLVVVSEAVKKRTAFIKVSTEMLGDIDFMRSEINNELTTRLSLDIDDQILNGDDTGQNLNGIVTQQTAFAAGIFALTVDNANLVDVLTVAEDQIDAANHNATVHVLNGRDITALKLVKLSTTDKRYIDRLVDVAGQMSLDGVPIVKNNGVTQGTHLTMDGSKATVFSKGEMTIQVGLDSDDFTKNFRTVLIEWRGLNRIEGNDLTAFVGGTIATSETALETL